MELISVLAELPDTLGVMVLIRRLLQAAALVLLAHPASAVSQTVDVSVAGSIAPVGIQYQGTIATVTLVFTNVGTVATTAIAARSNSLPFLTNEAVIPGPFGPSPCTMFSESFLAPPGSGGQSTLRFQVEVGPLAVGQSRTCTFGLAVRSTTLTPFTLRIETVAVANGVFDSNPSNNFFVLPLEFGGAQPVPAASLTGLLLLVLSVFGTTAIAFRRLRAP